LTTAVGLTPGGSVVVRTISIHRTTQTITEKNTNNSNTITTAQL